MEPEQFEASAKLHEAQPDLESCCRVLNEEGEGCVAHRMGEELRGRVTDSDELLWHIDQAALRFSKKQAS